MTKVIPWIIIALVVGFAVRRRMRGGKGAPPAWRPRFARRPARRADGGVRERLLGVVGLVAEREIRQRVRGKVFRGATLLILVGIAAAIVIPAVHKSKPTPLRVGVVGTLPTQVQQAIDTTASGLGGTAHVVDEASQDAADSALRTGNGAMPPSPQSDPSTMVSHRSVRSCRFSSGAMPSRIRSMTSTPRVDPMRQGRCGPRWKA